jgi:hypothetical protein
MMKRIGVVALFALMCHAGIAQPVDTFRSALANGATTFDLRLRGEVVDHEAIDDAAQALTLRAALSYRTGVFHGLSGSFQVEAVGAPVGDDWYNNIGAGDRWNGVHDRPVIADPTGVGVNQAWLRWTRNDAAVTAGRQEVILADARFVGNVGWRQDHQSFDAIRGDVTGERFEASYAFLREAHAITGLQRTMRSHVAFASARLEQLGTFEATVLLLNLTKLRGASTATYALRFHGSRPVGSLSALYDAGFGFQRDAFDNPNAVEASYYRVLLGVERNGTSISASAETLGGSENGVDGSFATPLATLHGFNGWADVFLATPSAGLTDLSVSVATRWRRMRGTLVVHDFSADAGGAHYGSEIDGLLTVSLQDGPVLGFKVAHYIADDLGSDITKAWIWASYTIK